MIALTELQQTFESPFFQEEGIDLTRGEMDQYKLLLNNEELIDFLKQPLETKEHRKAMEHYLFIADRIYRLTGIDAITDQLYDELFEHAKLNGLTPKDTEQSGVFEHKYPIMRGTLGKIHYGLDRDNTKKDARGSFESFIRRVSRETGIREEQLEQEEMLLSLKVDGVSVIMECNPEGIVTRALKRGDTERNLADNIPLLEGINVLPLIGGESPGKEFALKTEVAMKYNDFENMMVDRGVSFESPRSAITSIINSHVTPKVKELLTYTTIVPLQLYVSGDDYTQPAYSYYGDITSTVRVSDLLVDFDAHVENYFKHIAEEQDLPADGVVLSFTSTEIIDGMARKDSVNQYEIAYKFKPTSKESVLLDVIFSVGTLGSITPVAKIKPIVMDGHTVDSPSLGSIGRLRKLGLMKGQNVMIRYDVVPYLEPIYDDLYETKTEEIIIPENCPECDHPLSRVNGELLCEYPNCPAIRQGLIVNYIQKVDIANISESTVKTFNEMGILNNVYDLYTLKEKRDKLTRLKGFGDKSIQRILDEIDRKKTLFDYEFYGSLGIRGTGRRVFMKLFEHYPEKQLMNDLYKQGRGKVIRKAMKVPGIGEITAITIVDGIESKMRLIDAVKSIEGFRLLQQEKKDYEKYFLFTKFRDDDLVKKLEARNIGVVDRYTKKVDAVIVPAGATPSSKVKKAISDGKPIITREELEEMLDN